MSEIKNKEALNRLASEDRLDKMIVLASPATWVSIVGAFMVIVGLLVWGFFGRLPTSVDVRGIYTNTQGTQEIFSQKDGFVLEAYVKEGEEIQAGDLIVTLGTEEEMFQLQQLDTRIQYVEAMTFDSEYDVVSADTQEMAALKLQAMNTEKDHDKQEAELELKKEKLQQLADEVNEKENVMFKNKEKYFATLNVSDERTQLRYNEANSDFNEQYSLYESSKNTYISAKENYYSLKDVFDAQYASYDPSEHSEQENATYNTEKEKVENARIQADDYEVLMKDQATRLENANKDLEVARKEYLEYLNSLSGVSAENTIYSAEYTEALNDYNTAKAQYKALSDEIDELQLQVLLSKGDSLDNDENYHAQFNNRKSAILLDLRAQRDAILHAADKGDVTASSDGVVYNIDLYPGKTVAKGSQVAIIKMLSDDENDVVFYVPLDEVRKIRKDMEVYVYPSTVKKEQYGHMIGTVTEIIGHVASNEDMLAQLGSENLAADFSKNGPVVEVRCDLVEDPETLSGYEWSSEWGANVPLETETIVTAKIITESKSPLDLFIPYLREKFDMEIKEEENK